MFIVMALVVASLVPIIVLRVFGPTIKDRKSFKLTIINFFMIYTIVLLSVYFYELYLDYKLMSFDLDGDGIFTGLENTPEKAKYMSLVINDTGRNFVPITGFIFSSLHSALFYLVIRFSPLKISRGRP